MLCVNDARTERELGRYDRRSGRLAVGDQAHVHEVAQALWDFLAGNGPGGAGVLQMPPLGTEGSNPDIPGAVEAWVPLMAAGVQPVEHVRLTPEPDFAEPYEIGEVREVEGRGWVHEVEGRGWVHEAWNVAEGLVDFEPAADYPDDFGSGAEYVAAEYMEYMEYVAGFEADEGLESLEGFGASEAHEIVEALKAAEVPETPAAVPAAPRVPESVSGRSRGKAGRLVDRRLGRLRRDGWAVLAPTGKQSGAEFDRLVIGPPGVFAITLKHTDAGDLPPAPGTAGPAAAASTTAAASADGAADAGIPDVSSIPGIFGGGGRRDAEFAARMLSAGSGMAVKVTPMLAFVGGASGVAAYPPPGRRADDPPAVVLIARGEDIADVLWGLPSVYSPQERRQISDSARRADLWRPA